MQLQAKDCQQPLEMRKEARTDGPLELSEESNPIDTMIFNFYNPELKENKFLLF